MSNKIIIILKNAVQVIILVPTQELGAQVARETHKLYELSNVSIKNVIAYW